MAIVVALQRFDGVEVESIVDTRNVMYRVLLQKPIAEFIWIPTIDYYDDTTFNGIQSERLRKEWAILIESTAVEEDREFLQQVDALLEKCARGIHLHVKFIGD